jgi:hypothetical protein
MISELDLVVLGKDKEEYGLKAQDVGTVVHVYDDHKGYEVEFVTGEGKTLAVLTLTFEDIRPYNFSGILHVRDTESIAY